jgi:4-hydroxy-3-methylbut-2-enyl diphosphate reductase
MRGKMRLLVAKSGGFCFGVKRAMDMALEAAKKYPKPIYTLGPLIHNPQAVQLIGQLGIQVRDRIKQISKGTVIFRSHGVSQEDFVMAKEKGLRILDATCPIVKKAQLHAKYLDRHGYAVLIVGDAEHPEVEAIRSYLGEDVTVVENVRAVKRLGPWRKLGVIAQTTQSQGLFKEVVASGLERAKEVRVYNTIRQATTIRQREAIEIAKKVECMVVVGGYNSGNTQTLSAICKEIQPQTYQIETAQELNPRWFNHREKVGLTAGASTPRWIIREVEDGIRRLKGLKP